MRVVILEAQQVWIMNRGTEPTLEIEQEVRNVGFPRANQERSEEVLARTTSKWTSESKKGIFLSMTCLMQDVNNCFYPIAMSVIACTAF